MKTLKQQTLSIILSMIMILSCFAGMTFSVGADDVADMKKTISSMSVGETVEFGSYPQTDVTSSMGAELTAAAPSTDDWISYNYYHDGKQSDYMKYYDLTYNGSRYRGVYFTKYRPDFWNATSSANHQSRNGYSTNNVYWFRYDPLTWRILDPSVGYVICEDIIDSQAFNDEYYTIGMEDAYGNIAYHNDKTYTHFANNWEYSTVRTWLNETFFVTAFSSSERSQIPCTKLTTPACSTFRSDYDVGETGDYVFLPSYQDMLNSLYGFSSDDFDYNRRAHSSDYAKSQGVCVDTSCEDKYDKYVSYYRLRSAGYDSNSTAGVFYRSYVYDEWYTHYTFSGIRPALCFNPSSTALCFKHMEVTLSGKAATCTEKGFTDGTKCSVCGEILTAQEEIPALGHKEVKIEGKSATCTETGLTDGIKCSVCGEMLTVQEEIPALGHKEVKIAGKSATCTETGLSDGVKCSVCGEILTAQTEIPALGHQFDKGVCTVCGAIDPEYKLILKSDSKLILLEEKALIVGTPENTNGITADEFKSQIDSDINLDMDENTAISNGMTLKFGTHEYTVIIKGDANADSKINASDARTILRIAARLEQPDEITKEAADIDSDGKVTSAEARSVLRFAAKLQNKIDE